MYGAVRIILGCAVFGVLFLLLRKTKLARNKNIIISLIIAAIFCAASYMLPLENSFLSFSSPEEAFNYTNSENVAFVVDGSKSSLVIGEEAKGKYVFLVVPKSDNEWKLGRGIDTKSEGQIIEEDCIVNLYHNKKSGDYYIDAVNMGEEGIEIYDSCNSSFLFFESEPFNSCFANIAQFDENYWISVNGKQLSFTS